MLRVFVSLKNLNNPQQPQWEIDDFYYLRVFYPQSAHLPLSKMRIKKGLGVLNPPFPSITPKTPKEFKLSFHFRLINALPVTQIPWQVTSCFAHNSNSLLIKKFAMFKHPLLTN
jgi:hypothetical protein